MADYRILCTHGKYLFLITTLVYLLIQKPFLGTDRSWKPQLKDSKENHGDTGMHINYSFSCTERPSKELSCSRPGLCSSVNICL